MHKPITTYPALFIGEFSRVIKLIGEGNLQSGKLADLIFGFFQLAQKVSIFNREFLLGGVVIVQGAVDLIQLRVALV